MLRVLWHIQRSMVGRNIKIIAHTMLFPSSLEYMSSKTATFGIHFFTMNFQLPSCENIIVCVKVGFMTKKRPLHQKNDDSFLMTQVNNYI